MPRFKDFGPCINAPCKPLFRAICFKVCFCERSESRRNAKQNNESQALVVYVPPRETSADFFIERDNGKRSRLEKWPKRKADDEFDFGEERIAKWQATDVPTDVPTDGGSSMFDGSGSYRRRTPTDWAALRKKRADAEMGPMYGYQWRHFNAPYEGCDADYKDKGIDQLQNVIDCLKDPKQRSSRRLIVSAWNPCQVDEGALPSCHNFFQFNVVDGNKLSCSMFQRSNDEACGTTFNIASYSFLTHLIAKHCGLEAYEFVYFKGNCHIYEEHIDGLKLQITREPYPFPSITIKETRENINDYQVEDFVINNYFSLQSFENNHYFFSCFVLVCKFPSPILQRGQNGV